MQFWADDRGAAAVALSVRVKATSPEQMLSEVAGLLAARGASYREVSRQQAVVDGLPALWVEHTYDWDGVPQRGFMVGAVRNRVGYLLLAFSPVEQYPTWERAFRAIAGSLRVERFAAAPPYDQWLVYEGARATYHYLPETYAAAEIESIAAAHERVLEQNARSLAVGDVGPVHFFLYPSAESLYRATARTTGFAIAEAAEVHARWYSAGDHQSLGHEVTHVIAYAAMGEPGEALLAEGIAVCLDRAEPPPHARAAALLRAGQLVPLADLLGEDWFACDAAVAYAESGSVACWLLEQYGLDRFKQLYPRTDFTAALIEIYGFDVDALQAEWRSMLEITSAGPDPLPESG